MDSLQGRTVLLLLALTVLCQCVCERRGTQVVWCSETHHAGVPARRSSPPLRLRGAGAGGDEVVRPWVDMDQEIARGVECKSSTDDDTSTTERVTDSLSGSLDETLELHLQREAEQAADAQSLRDYADFLQSANKDLQHARALYTRSLQLDPASVRTHCSFGRLVHESGDLDVAERHYKAALLLDPLDLDTLSYSAVLAHRGRHELERAARHYTKVAPFLRLFPPIVRARVWSWYASRWKGGFKMMERCVFLEAGA